MCYLESREAEKGHCIYICISIWMLCVRFWNGEGTSSYVVLTYTYYVMCMVCICIYVNGRHPMAEEEKQKKRTKPWAIWICGAGVFINALTIVVKYIYRKQDDSIDFRMEKSSEYLHYITYTRIFINNIPFLDSKGWPAGFRVRSGNTVNNSIFRSKIETKEKRTTLDLIQK